jgi:outer membrane protein assembly factor BamB
MTLRFIILIGLMSFATVCRGDWLQFRGTNSNSIGGAETVPDKIGKNQNIAWKTDLPGRGLSSPVVIGERIVLTASSGARQDRLQVLAFDTKNGQQLWQRTFWATGPTDSHPKSCMAAPSPASDGKRIVALFGTNDLVCLDLDGNVKWIRSLYQENDGATDGRGLASSPLIVGATAIVFVENQNTSFAAGIDVESGSNRWRIERPRELNWTSPITLPGDNGQGELVLLQGSTRLSAIEPMTGKEVWGLDQKAHPIVSSVVDGQVLYLPAEKGLAAYSLQPRPMPPKLLWEENRLQPATGSPVVSGGRVYSLKGAILVTGDAKTGKVLGQLRLKGNFSSTPILAGGLLFCFNEDGTAFVIKPGEPEPTLVHEGPLEESILCTPAVSNGALYVRSDKHVWKLAK